MCWKLTQGSTNARHHPHAVRGHVPIDRDLDSSKPAHQQVSISIAMNTLALEALLSYLSKEVDSELQIQTFRCFMFVAHRGSCTQKDVEEGLGVSNASASRNISYWTEQRFDRRPGKGFIMRVEDPNDRRYRLLTLTKRGREFFEELRTFGKVHEHGTSS